MLALLRRKRAELQDANVVRFERRNQIVIVERIRIADQRPHGNTRGLKRLGRGASIEAHFLHARVNALHQPGDADHEEFIDVGAENGKKLCSLQKRIGRLASLLQNPPLKLQMAELPVHIQGRLFQVDGRNPDACFSRHILQL